MTVRVLVVDDSITVRQRLCAVLEAQPDIEVVGQAEDGGRAIELCEKLRPDVVTLDMILPTVSGVAATEHIMAHFPTPILIVSSSTNRGELFKTYDALAAGAVEVLDKPGLNDDDVDWEARFIATVRLVARIPVITHPRARLGAYGRIGAAALPAVAPPQVTAPFRVVALGASTGGPSALVEVLRGIPVNIPVPVLIVLHIGESFGDAFAEWLDSQSPHRVSYAREGDIIAGARGRVLIAPPGKHLEVRGGRALLTAGPERHSCRPSVDVLFESLARDCGAETVACLLTGMGRDGAAGLLDVRNAGGATIAQDEATSVIYGMPREAVLMGAASRVLPLSEIGPAVGHLLTHERRKAL